MSQTTYSPIPLASNSFRSDSSIRGSVPAAFDVALYKPAQAMTGALKLVIQLRINLRPLPPKLIPMTLDADGKPYWTKPWTNGDWQNFVASAVWQSNMWNNKFWLAPPPTFTEYDVHIHGSAKVWRPNIVCELKVDFAAAGGAHLTIDIANLNAITIKGVKNSSTFRSHALLYDTLDSVPSVIPWRDSTGFGQLTKYTIAHEIGHAIGLGHIGELLRTPLCQFAISTWQAGIDHFHGLTEGGSNGLYCYGYEQDRKVGGNIMGSGGNNFTVENAIPWLWAILHLRRQPELFRVLLSDPGPGAWVR